MFKKILLLVAVCLLGLGIYQRELLSYGYMQAKGQLTILWNVQQVTEVLNDPKYPETLKQKIRLIEEIKKFGVDSLGLHPSDNYTTFYDQHDKPLIWVLTASPRYKIEAHKWDFPIIGSFPYKGYFDSTRAVADQQLFIAQHMDTDIGDVSAWSTLGYFKDPVLSSMLERKEGSLANLILHELTHGTLFVKNNLELNENLASFIGDYGAIRFLKFKYGIESRELKDYEFSKKYNDAYSQHMLLGIKELDSLYLTFGENQDPDLRKDSLKKFTISGIVANIDTLMGGKIKPKNKKFDPDVNLPNNAVFISYKTYKSKQNTFRDEFRNTFKSDFKAYFSYLQKKYPSI